MLLIWFFHDSLLSNVRPKNLAVVDGVMVFLFIVMLMLVGIFLFVKRMYTVFDGLILNPHFLHHLDILSS